MLVAKILWVVFFSTLAMMRDSFAIELKFEQGYADNLDRIFLPKDRALHTSRFIVNGKFKEKILGLTMVASPTLNLNYSHSDHDLRDKAISAPVVMIKPIKKGLTGFMADVGFNGGHSYAYNVISNDHEKLFSDSYFLEAQAFFIKKITSNIKSSNFIGLRAEDYKKTYSVYLNEENDNLRPLFQSDLEGKWGPKLPYKFSFLTQRNIYRERRALSKEGLFVSTGEKLVPDIIDNHSLSYLQTYESNANSSFSLGPVINLNEDRVNGGRSYFGKGVNGLAALTLLNLETEMNVSYLKREYRTQLSTFQETTTNEKLEDESFIYGLTLNKKLPRDINLSFKSVIENTVSNQRDSLGRRMSNYKTQLFSLIISRNI